MRILHISDFHFRKKWFRWLEERASDFEAVYFTGDFLDASKPNELPRQIEWVQNWLTEFPVPPFVCSGNHDWFLREPDGDLYSECHWLKSVGNSKITSDGTNRFLSGVTFECFGWLAPIRPSLEKSSVLLCHAPPMESAISRSYGMDSGDFELAEVIRILPKGTIILSGHVHTPEKWYARIGMTPVFNPGCDFRAVAPAYIVVDLQRRVAIYEGKTRDTVAIR